MDLNISTQIDIRTARADEASALEEFIVSIDGEEWRDFTHNFIGWTDLKDSRLVFIVATYRDKIIGAAAYSRILIPSHCWGIGWICIDKGYRNNGIATRLIGDCLSRIKKEITGKTSVLLATYPGKTRLYEKCGFEFAGYDYEGGSFMTKVIGE